jgi:hypothetical protein
MKLTFKNIFDTRASSRALIVLMPIILLGITTRSQIWLHVAIVTISVFVALERSNLAPLGVLTHAFLVASSYIGLICSLANPALFILMAVLVAMGSILVTAKGEKLRSAGTFTLIPALYLACETAQGVPHRDLLETGLRITPYILAASVPVLLVSIIEYRRFPPNGRSHRWDDFKLVKEAGDTPAAGYIAKAIMVALGVAIAVSLVEWNGFKNGQWVIWSSVSVLITGNLSIARVKWRDRTVGTLLGVPAGIAIATLLPHNFEILAVATLATALTLVAFRSYAVGFGARCMCVSFALIVAGETTLQAGSRIENVIIGSSIGIVVWSVSRSIRVNSMRFGKL